MIKIPLLNRFITDDQDFYDAQINEELKYCNSDNLVIVFTDIGKNQRRTIWKWVELNKKVDSLSLSELK